MEVEVVIETKRIVRLNVQSKIFGPLKEVMSERRRCSLVALDDVEEYIWQNKPIPSEGLSITTINITSDGITRTIKKS